MAIGHLTRADSSGSKMDENIMCWVHALVEQGDMDLSPGFSAQHKAKLFHGHPTPH